MFYDMSQCDMDKAKYDVTCFIAYIFIHFKRKIKLKMILKVLMEKL